MELTPAQKRFIYQSVKSDQLDRVFWIGASDLPMRTAYNLIKKGVLQRIETWQASFTPEGKQLALDLLAESEK